MTYHIQHVKGLENGIYTLVFVQSRLYWHTLQYLYRLTPSRICKCSLIGMRTLLHRRLFLFHILISSSLCKHFSVSFHVFLNERWIYVDKSLESQAAQVTGSSSAISPSIIRRTNMLSFFNFFAPEAIAEGCVNDLPSSSRRYMVDE